MTRRFASVVLLSALAACGGEPKSKTSSDTTSAAVPTPTPATTAPVVFRARFETSRGPFVVEAHRDWSPNGVDRFYQLVKSGYFDNVRFYRVIPGFMAQFGIHGDPAVYAKWERLAIPDDPVLQSNKRGYVTFANRGANTRSTNLFINFGDNSNLDAMGFSPIGVVVEGMAAVDSIYSGYGEEPQQPRIWAEGNAYLEKSFPKLDFIRTARVIEPTAADSAKK